MKIDNDKRRSFVNNGLGKDEILTYFHVQQKLRKPPTFNWKKKSSIVVHDSKSWQIRDNFTTCKTLMRSTTGIRIECGFNDMRLIFDEIICIRFMFKSWWETWRRVQCTTIKHLRNLLVFVNEHVRIGTYKWRITEMLTIFPHYVIWSNMRFCSMRKW